MAQISVHESLQHEDAHLKEEFSFRLSREGPGTCTFPQALWAIPMQRAAGGCRSLLGFSPTPLQGLSTSPHGTFWLSFCCLHELRMYAKVLLCPYVWLGFWVTKWLVLIYVCSSPLVSTPPCPTPPRIV